MISSRCGSATAPEKAPLPQNLERRKNAHFGIYPMPCPAYAPFQHARSPPRCPGLCTSALSHPTRHRDPAARCGPRLRALPHRATLGAIAVVEHVRTMSSSAKTPMLTARKTRFTAVEKVIEEMNGRPTDYSASAAAHAQSMVCEFTHL